MAVSEGASGAISNVDRAQAAKFLDVELAAHEVERVGIGAEGEDGREDGEKGGAMHGGCWCAWVTKLWSKLVWYSGARFWGLERGKIFWWLRILTVGENACRGDLGLGG